MSTTTLEDDQDNTNPFQDTKDPSVCSVPESQSLYDEGLPSREARLQRAREADPELGVWVNYDYPCPERATRRPRGIAP